MVWEKAAVVYLSYYLGIHVDVMRKATKILKQDNHVQDEF
jgi:hypothetical protein